MLQTEQVAQLALCIAGLYFQPVHLAWWCWPLVFLAPDISMLGYFVSPAVGAFTYNLFHHKAVATVVMAAGFFMHLPVVLFIGLVLYAHSAYDRILGYGLKYTDSFNHTHLGMVGKKRLVQPVSVA